MNRDLAGADISRANFDKLATLCLLDSQFPADFDSWQMLVDEGTKHAAKTGFPCDRIEIPIEEFAQWCQRAEVHPCLAALRAFLIVQRRRGKQTTT